MPERSRRKRRYHALREPLTSHPVALILGRIGGGDDRMEHLTWAGKPMALIPRGWKRTWHSPDMGWKAHGTYAARLEKDMAFA